MKKSNIFPFITPILYIALGVFAIVTGNRALIPLCVAAGVIMIILGAAFAISYIARKAETNISNGGFVIGAMLITLGILTIILRNVIILYVPIAFGFSIILNGFRQMQKAIDIFKSSTSKPWIIMIISVVNIMAGVFFMIAPDIAADMIMTIIGIAVIISGISDLITVILAYKMFKKLDKNSKEINV